MSNVHGGLIGPDVKFRLLPVRFPYCRCAAPQQSRERTTLARFSFSAGIVSYSDLRIYSKYFSRNI